MKQVNFRFLSRLIALCVAACALTHAQTAADMAALQGLAPVATLLNSDAGKAALAANYKVTGGIQSGTLQQPTRLPFAEQQQQALRDAFITGSNLAQLSDGLGTTLGSAYLARFHYTDHDHFTDAPQALIDLIAYASAVTSANSGSGKYFFGNGKTSDGNPVSNQAAAILTAEKGRTDIFGQAYNLPIGSPGADPNGNSRPFQTEKNFLKYSGRDYFGAPADDVVYNYGPAMNLLKSPSYPSGHTTYGYTGALLLAIMVPQRYGQMIVRGAEYGNDRIIIGSHYAMDVIGGRTLALYDIAHLLNNDRNYVGQSLKGAPQIADFREAVNNARAELVKLLQADCGGTIEVCAKRDTGRFSNAAADKVFYDSTQTYNLGVVYPEQAGKVEDVGKIAPEAGWLLMVAFPKFTLKQADKILTETEGPGGGFLDNGSAFGLYSRLNLYAASLRAEQIAHKK
jgi:hypothetical protein